MTERDPFEILGINVDSGMSVIKAAYKMKVNICKSGSDDLEMLAEVEWAYAELTDAKLRNEYRLGRVKGGDMSFETNEKGIGEDKVHMEYENNDGKNSVWSILLSTGLFFLMISTIGYGLYYVGAVRTDEGYEGESRQYLDNSKGSATLEIPIIATDIPEISKMHTATVEALKVTATHESLIMYSEGLTATNYAMKMPSPTPTRVLIQACPNAISINVRTGPGTSYSALGQLLQGDCVTVLGRNEDNSWIVITDSPRPSLNNGWISIELMDMESSGEELGVIYSN
jgi:hypothetical protein